MKIIVNNIHMEELKTSKKIVLVIEDDPTILELYEHAFKAAGFETFLARDGEEGIGLIESKLPDCVILDILMPKMNGVEVLKKMRENEKTKNTPVLVLTNYDTYRDQVKEYNVSDYIVKADVTLKDIVEKVLSILNK